METAALNGVIDMAKELAGKTISITTHRDMNVDGIVEVVRKAFEATLCRGCTSGGHLILREGQDVSPTEAEATVTVTALG
jgi:hypothetical protein